MSPTSGQLRKWRDRIEDYLDVWGDVRVTDDGAAGDRRLIEFALEAPGQDLPVEIRARYAEYYRRQRSGDWLIAKYHYEYLDIGHGRQLAYHMDDIGSRGLVRCSRSIGESFGREGRQTTTAGVRVSHW